MASIRIPSAAALTAAASSSAPRPHLTSSSIPQANLQLRSPLCRATADIERRLPGGQRRRSSPAAAASASVAAAASAAGKDSDASSPFDLEDELAALDAAVLDDLAEAGALADLSRGDPGEGNAGPRATERPVPTDPSKRHRKRRAGEKGLSAAFLRALTEEAMNGGSATTEGGEGDDFPSYGGFEQFGEEGEEEEDGFLPDGGGGDGGGDGPSSTSSTAAAARVRPGAGDVLTQDELDAAPPGFRAGYVALVGRPNAGKSTLLNALLGRKLSIVTPKAQTTRQRVLGIASGSNCQMVLLDTPGLLRGDKAPNALDRRMAAAVSKATADADAVLALVDASAPGAAGAAQEAVAKLVVAAAVGAATSKQKKRKERKNGKGRKELSREGAEVDEEEEEEAARALEAVRIALGARQQGDEEQEEEQEEEEEEQEEEEEEEEGEDGIDDDDGEEDEPVSAVAALAAANAAANASAPSGRTPVAILLNKVDAAAPGRVDEIEAVVRQAVREAAGEARAAVAAARAEAAKTRRGRGGEGATAPDDDEGEEALLLEADFDVPVFRTCALTGSGVAAAADWAAAALPESPPLYPSHLLADAPERFFVAEIVREKIFLQYREEVPYACAVEVTEYIEREGTAKDYAAVSIFVERQQQKGILLGAGGSALKRLGAAARADAEVFLGRPLYMEISVKVAPKWRSDDRTVRQFGY